MCLLCQRLVSEISHTVEFDFDEIEASTARLCQHNLAQSDQSEDEGRLHFGQDPLYPRSDVEIAAPSNPIVSSNRSGLFNPLSEQIQDLSIGLKNVNDLETLVSLPYGADQILAKAQGCSGNRDCDIYLG